MKNVGGLTIREMECLCWASKGKTACETAIIMGISYETARWYRKQVREKLDCCTLAQAVSTVLTNREGNPTNIHGERYDWPHRCQS
jgi:DNA-binding CsgD family transcriptional regulator